MRLSAFLGTALEEITDLEHSKLLRTIMTLLLRPGALTTEYLSGRRKAFIGPVKIFLSVFALSFLLYSVVKATSIYDLNTLASASPGNEIRSAISRLAQRTHLSESALIAEINARWQNYLTLTQAVYPLGIALLYQLLYFRARRYFAEHLIFALHFSSISLGLAILFWPIYVIAGVRLGPVYSVTTTLSLLVTLLWLTIANRRVYGGSWWASGIKAAVIEVGYFAIGLAITLLTLWWATRGVGSAE
ncbi:hypothetical protein BH20VER3_BH20VER3_16050 [soil metagenome]